MSIPTNQNERISMISEFRDRSAPMANAAAPPTATMRSENQIILPFASFTESAIQEPAWRSAFIDGVSSVLAKLAPDERNVFVLAVSQRPNTEIASRLGINADQVAALKKKVFDQLHLHFA
jgi:DNA-directed RNA polymerase specialized sigma24 family protein